MRYTPITFSEIASFGEDSHNIPASSEKNASLSSTTYDLRGATIGNLAHNVQGSQQNYPQQTNNNNPEEK
ncbi:MULTISPECIES: hypothetical protein [Microcystis]|uniref:Uncharacterized protein n=1 Tax=Microcystis aeruginosa BLCC-F108 TaxID=2755317 RepID=A0A841UQK0_MICAE|nr:MULTISPECIES: hypothetical protein [Microcystis]MBC1193323.1 hypothetical protein [Microcystis aeruginosa BLCC-F108]MBE9071786.1 hypothetical protein [Microcystis sp. LEGE 08355]MCA2590621.1 hypothetical protein [Microcystis sp. M31BS1]MDB9407642.1 hypothetical protein [Microcystis aeruginosa CS-558/01A06]